MLAGLLGRNVAKVLGKEIGVVEVLTGGVGVVEVLGGTSMCI